MDFAQKMEFIRSGRPKVMFCERFNETSNIWNFKPHSHPYIELMFFMEGTASVDIAEAQMTVSLFDTVIYPAYCTHQEDPAPHLKREIICLWVDLPELVLDAPLKIRDHDSALSSLFQSIHREYRRDPQIPNIVEYQVKTLLTLALHYADTGDQGQVLPKAMQYIHANFNRQIRLDTLADLEHISKSYLSRQFKGYTGMTVIEYINHLRVEMAKHLLVSSNDSITDIGYQVGFESPKYYYRTFRAAIGQSPSKFRRTYCQSVGDAGKERAGDGEKDPRSSPAGAEE